MKEMIAPILQGGKTGGVFTFVPSALQGLHGYKCAPEMGPDNNICEYYFRDIHLNF